MLQFVVGRLKLFGGEQAADGNSKYGGYYWAGRFVEEMDALTVTSYSDGKVGILCCFG